MPVARFQMPDGRIARFEVPEGTTPEQAQQMLAQQVGQASTPSEAERSTLDKVKQQAGNVLGGAIRGAGSIGATILWPVDKAMDLADAARGVSDKGLKGLVTGERRLSRNEQRRLDMDDALRELGADTDSLTFKGAKLGTEIAGTLGAGGAAANAAARLPGVAAAAPNLINAIRTAGMSAGGATGATGLGVRAAGGAVNGAVSAGMINPQDAMSGAVLGGALPGVTKALGAAGRTIGGAIKGGGVAPEVAALAKRAGELGIDIPADRLVNSKPLDALASALNYVPFSGRAATESRMSEQLNRAASRLMGQDSSNINLALRKAGEDLGGKFENTLRNTGVKFDQELLEGLSNVYNTAERELGSDALKPIAAQVDEIIKKGADGAIDGQAAYNIKRQLDRLGKGNTPTAYHALELKSELMGALNRSLGPDGAQAFAKTRQQYGNMLALEKLAKNGVEGEISVARLANLSNINNKPLQEIADIAAQFVKPREGQHGAMQRAMVGGVAALTGGPLGLLGGAAGGRALNSALNSGAARSLLMEGAAPSLGLLAGPQATQLGYRVAPLLGADL